MALRHSPLASLVLGTLLVSRDGRSVEGARVQGVPPVIIKVDDARGIPAQTCDEALGRVPEPKPETAPRPVRPSESTGTPDLQALPKITLEGLAFDRKSLPGGDPASLPSRALEGPKDVLAKVGAVFLKAGAKQRVRITFFGASHTSGDFLTGRIRRVLQRRYGDIGHGFLFTAAIHDGYRAQDVNLCRSDRWFADYVGKKDGRDDGLYPFGASVSSSDPGQFGWIETTHANPEGRNAQSYDLFTLGQPQGGALLVQIDEAAPVQVSTRSDRSVLLHHRFEVPDGPHRFRMSPAGDAEVRVFGLSVERPGPGVIVDAIGIRGRTAKTWLSWERTIANQALATLQPDLIVLAYGTNEGNDLKYTMDQYRSDLDHVLAGMRVALPDAACVLMGPSDRGVKIDEHTFGVWDRTQWVAQVQREVAPLYGCAFWDWQAATGGPGSMIGWYVQDPPLASADLIHFTQPGYERVGDMFLAALDAAAMGAMGR
jgi:lysophospholipase L1-like esterase